MLLVPGEERRLDLGLGHWDVHPLSVVLDRDHVRALLGEEREQLAQLPRPVGDSRADDEVAAGEREPVPHDLDQQGRVDVAAGEERGHRAGSADPPGEQGRDRCGARTLDDELDALEEQHDRLADLLVADGDDLVEEVLDERRRELPGA